MLGGVRSVLAFAFPVHSPLPVHALVWALLIQAVGRQNRTCSFNSSVPLMTPFSTCLVPLPPVCYGGVRLCCCCCMIVPNPADTSLIGCVVT